MITVLTPTALLNYVGGFQQDVPPCLAFPLRFGRLFPSPVIQHNHLRFRPKPGSLGDAPGGPRSCPARYCFPDLACEKGHPSRGSGGFTGQPSTSAIGT